MKNKKENKFTMNDIIEALKTRVSSPIFGYYGLALIALNWQGFFYLFVHSGDALIRIQYFEQHSTVLSLTLWPFLLSLLIATIHPWFLYALSWLTAKPIELKDMIQDNSEHKVLIKRKQLEEARSSLLASAEREIIERANRDQELDKLQNQELRENVKKELDQLRSERDRNRESNQASPVFQHKELMDAAGTYRERASQATNLEDRENFRKWARELEQRAHQILLGVANKAEE